MSNDTHDIPLNFWSYYIPIVLVVSTIANFLCVFVLFRTEMKNMVTRYYFIGMIIANQTWLFCLGISWLGVKIMRETFCSIALYFPTVLQFLSAYFIVAFMVERNAAVRFPPRRQVIKNTKIIMLGITISGLLLSALTFIVYDTNCDIWIKGMYLYGVIKLFIIDIVPFVTIVILTIRIVTMIRGQVTTGSILMNTTNGTNNTDQVSAGQRISNTISPMEQNITKMLFIVANVYVSLNLVPNLISILSIQTLDVLAVTIIYNIAFALSLMSSGIPLFVCCVVDQDFRKATLATILCRRQSHSEIPQTILYTRVNSEPNASPVMTSTGD